MAAAPTASVIPCHISQRGCVAAASSVGISRPDQAVTRNATDTAPDAVAPTT